MPTDAEAGRHDGAVDGVRYFDAVAKRGLFARAMWATAVAGPSPPAATLAESVAAGARGLRDSLAYRRTRLQSHDGAANAADDAGGWSDSDDGEEEEE